MKRFSRRLLVALLAAFLLMPVMAMHSSAAEIKITITNPYESVDWAKAKPYRTQLHTHTTASDGKQTMAEAIENYYSHGYDFVAVTDHGVVDRGWAKPNHIPFYGVPDKSWTEPVYDLFSNLFGSRKIQGLTEARLREITAGEGRGGRGMLRVPLGIEQNPNGHCVEINSWFCDWGNFVIMPSGDYEYEYPTKNVHRAGGLSMLNHPTEAIFNRGLSFEELYEGENYGYVNKVQLLFEKYSSLLGIELARNAGDLKLWDTLLTNLSPAGRNVFGFATSDSHGADTVDDGWVWALMEGQTVENLRGCLAAGAFFAGLKGDAAKAEPMVTEITVKDGTIAIIAENHETVQWISGGKVIATGGEFSLSEHAGELGAYVRAEVRGEGGTLYMQPFLLSYDGMPVGRPVPSDYIDEGRSILVTRTLLYPFLRALDGIWKMINWL